MVLVLVELSGAVAEDFPDGLSDLKFRRDPQGITIGEPILPQFLHLGIPLA